MRRIFTRKNDKHHTASLRGMSANADRRSNPIKNLLHYFLLDCFVARLSPRCLAMTRCVVMVILLAAITLSAHAWRPEEFFIINPADSCPAEYDRITCDPFTWNDCPIRLWRDGIVFIPDGGTCPDEFIRPLCDPFRWSDCPVRSWRCGVIAVVGNCPAEFITTNLPMPPHGECNNIMNELCDATRGTCEITCTPI